MRQMLSKLAEDPELVINAYFTFNFLAKIFSKKDVFLPIVIIPDFKTLIP